MKNFVHEGDDERGAIIQESAEHIVIGRVYDRRHPVPRPFGLPDLLRRLEAKPPPLGPDAGFIITKQRNGKTDKLFLFLTASD